MQKEEKFSKKKTKKKRKMKKMQVNVQLKLTSAAIQQDVLEK